MWHFADANGVEGSLSPEASRVCALVPAVNEARWAGDALEGITQGGVHLLSSCERRLPGDLEAVKKTDPRAF